MVDEPAARIISFTVAVASPSYPPGMTYPPAMPPPRKSNTTRTVLIVVGVVLALCCAGGVIGGFAIFHAVKEATGPARATVDT